MRTEEDAMMGLFGNKIRVMETSAQIAVKIMEALK